MKAELARRGRSGLLRWAFLVVALLGAGLWVRSLPATTLAPGLAEWWESRDAPVVTLYFNDGPFLFPVSRRMPASADVPLAALEALLAGPTPASGLGSQIPPGVEIRSFQLSDGVARIDLSAAMLDEHPHRAAAETAIVETMTALAGISSVVLSVEGELVGEPARRVPLLYYASSNGLVAVPGTAGTPRAAVAAYMAGPPSAALTGLPRDVRLLNYEYDQTDGLVSLEFTYTASIRALAVEQPDRMRSVLLGLTASLTELPDVAAVQLDFEGRTRLGLGQCSDLLRTPQRRPRLLNDERLLGR